jgi:PKD repeat protein
MPRVTALDLERLRRNKHSSRVFLAVYTPDVVWTAQVDTGAFPGSTTIPVTGQSAWGEEQLYYAIRVGSEAGWMDKGIARYISRETGAIDVAANAVNWATGDYLSMVKEIRPEACIPFVSENIILEDGWRRYSDTYGTGPQELEPYANFGPPACIFEGSPALFYSQACHVFPLSTHIDSYDWFFDGGTTVTGATGWHASGLTGAGAPGDPHVVHYAGAGMYYPRLTVTDSNNNTMRGYRPVMVFGREENQPYRDFQVSNIRGDVGSRGWSCSIEVFGDADIDQFPEMAMVVVFAEDQYDDEEVSIGGAYCHRENIIFVGYIESGTVSYEPSAGSVSFGLIGLPSLMNSLSLWPANLYTTGNVGWHNIQGMNFDAAARHIIGEHTTLDHIVDIYPTRDTKSLINIDVPEASALDQLDRQLYSAINAKVLGNRQGMLFCERDPQMMSQADRAMLGQTMVIRSQDAEFSVQLATEHHVDRACQVVLSAFGYDAADDLVAYDSIYPANQVDYGSLHKQSGIRVETQEEANEIAELVWLQQNSQFEQTLVGLAGNYRVFDIAPIEYCRFGVNAADNVRGIRWDDVKMVPTEVGIDIGHHGVIRTSVRLEKDNLEAAGVVGDYPQLYDLDVLLEQDGLASEGATGPPICDFTSYPSSGVGATLAVQFYDRTRGCGKLQWQWEFGDNVGTAYDQNPQHEYTATGSYDVTMTVWNSYGTCAIEKTDQVVLRNSRPAFEKSHTLTTTVPYLECAGIAIASGYAYFGGLGSPGRIVKVDVSGTPSQAGSMTAGANEDDFNACAIATDNVCGYFATYTRPTTIVKINLAAMTRVEALTLATGENFGGACVLDSNNRYLYVGTQTGPATVTRIDVGANPLVNNMAVTGQVQFSSGENTIWGAAIDSADQDTYWGCYTNPGRLVKVDISAGVSRDDAIVCRLGEGSLGAVAIDDADEYAYAVTYFGRQVVKFRLSDFLRIGNVRLNMGDNYLETLLHDDVGNHLFAASVTEPGRVIKVDLADMSRVGHEEAAVADGAIACGVIDPDNGYMYFGTLASGGRVLRFGTGD